MCPGADGSQTMKTENEYLLIERGKMARQQRPLTARDRTTSTPSLHKARYIEERPVTSLRRHRACSACIQDRSPRCRVTDTCSHPAKPTTSRYGRHPARLNGRSGEVDRGQRSKYVPYSAAVFKSLHSDDTPETTSSRSEAEVRADMSCGELPPIQHRSGSAKSRDGSSGGGGGGLPVKPTSVFRYEKTPLLSADCHALIEGSTGSGRAATKRAHIGAQSNGSSSPSQQSTNPGHSGGGGGRKSQRSQQLSRAKSWCATESRPEQSPRLETLFERNGMISGGQRDRSKSTAPLGADRNKPPARSRLRGQAAHATSSMTIGLRSLSNSVSNLSKASDAAATFATANDSATQRPAAVKQVNFAASYRNRKALQNAHKFKSEQNLTSLGASAARRPEVGRPTPVGGRGQHQSGSVGAPERRLCNNDNNNDNGNYKVNSLRNIRSQPQMQLSASAAPSDDALTTQNLKHIENQLDDSGSDSDYERNQRIQDWLIGTEEAERPDNPDIIVDDEPKQTDTAIHIVYDKD